MLLVLLLLLRDHRRYRHRRTRSQHPPRPPPRLRRHPPACANARPGRSHCTDSHSWPDTQSSARTSWRDVRCDPRARTLHKSILCRGGSSRTRSRIAGSCGSADRERLTVEVCACLFLCVLLLACLHRLYCRCRCRRHRLCVNTLRISPLDSPSSC